MSVSQQPDLKSFIRDIPDFPKPGIVFKDITPLLADGPAFQRTVSWMVAVGRACEASKVVAIESRGFIFGSAVAHALGVGVVPVRKEGKLPFRTLSAEYTLEYGTGVLEMHVDALNASDRVLVVDDVLATGGTAAAVAELIRRAGGQPAALAFVIELGFLEGRSRLPGLPVEALMRFS